MFDEQRETMFSEQIAKGVAWLDENRPGWFNEIDLHTFDMKNSSSCCLGQTGGYDMVYNQHGMEFMIINGFNLPYGTWSQWDILTHEWKDIILARKNGFAADSVPVVNTTDVLRKWITEAISVGRNGTEGDYTVSGIVAEILNELNAL